MQKSVISLPTQPSTMSGRTNHRTTKTCHRACLFAIADFADTKKLNLLGQENGITEIEKLSQTIDSQERPVGNTGLAKVAVQCFYDSFVGKQTLVHLINFCGENRHLRQARNRYLQPYRTTVLTIYKQ